MATDTVSTDRTVGFGVLFGLLGVLAALVMLVAGLEGSQVTAGWAFAAAMVAGGVLVTAIHAT